jgi:GTP cyclohydrolase I
MIFINQDLRVGEIRERLERMTAWHEVIRGRLPVLEGALIIEEFLTPEARQHIEGQVYSSGTDLATVYRTGRTGFGDNEINITEADEQVPLIGELRREIDDFLGQIFPGSLSAHAFQLRELTPKASGHSRHVDYERGFDVHEKDGERYGLTSLSLSLPISWNEGRAPTFVMETGSGDFKQHTPGSLAIFGPCIFHSHPPTTDFEKPYLWLVTQAFFKTPLESSGLRPERRPPIVDSRTTTETHAAASPLAAWVSGVVGHHAMDKVLLESESRIRRAYRELLSGYEMEPGKILNEVERVESYSGLVVERGIHFTSFCGHHFLPFHGTIDVAYEPGNVITGLGKIPRLVQAFARRLQLQEFLVRDIALQIANSLKAKGVYVEARALHLCIHARGPSAPGAETVCSFGTGTLENESRRSFFR